MRARTKSSLASNVEVEELYIVNLEVFSPGSYDALGEG